MKNLINGVGIDDADYKKHTVINGKRTVCKIYSKWRSMITRCYSSKYREKHPTYNGCSVCDEWLSFMSFRSWLLTKNWEGMALDKDIKYSGNKIYSPDTCLLVTTSINSMMTMSDSSRGKYPPGVSLNKPSGKYYAIFGRKFLGSFDNQEDASNAYKEKKSDRIIAVANLQEPKLKGYLLRIAKETQANLKD